MIVTNLFVFSVLIIQIALSAAVIWLSYSYYRLDKRYKDTFTEHLRFVNNIGEVLTMLEKDKDKDNEEKVLCPKCMKETNKDSLNIFGCCRDCLNAYSETPNE